mgnify:CR=1 FL=1
MNEEIGAKKTTIININHSGINNMDKLYIENKIKSLSKEDLEKLQYVADILKSGGIVAFPTETVYGLGANGLDEKAVEKIFKAKGRPSDNPLILHVASLNQMQDLVLEIPQNVEKLIDRFWPGPLTLVMKKGPKVPDIITGGLDTVAIRMPAHPIALKLIEMSGLVLAAPSANISGKPSPTRGEHVVRDLDNKVDAIIMAGECNIGLESTVLDMTGGIPTILRPGGISKSELEKVLDRVDLDKGLIDSTNIKPKSPGMKYTHYAPEATVYIVRGKNFVDNIKNLSKKYEKKGKNVGILCFDDTYNNYDNPVVKSLGARNKLEEAAFNLFNILREFDDLNVDIVLSEAVEEVGMGQAIMNRLIKAAGNRIIEGE